MSGRLSFSLYTGRSTEYIGPASDLRRAVAREEDPAAAAAAAAIEDRASAYGNAGPLKPRAGGRRGSGRGREEA